MNFYLSAIYEINLKKDTVTYEEISSMIDAFESTVFLGRIPEIYKFCMILNKIFLNYIC